MRIKDDAQPPCRYEVLNQSSTETGIDLPLSRVEASSSDISSPHPNFLYSKFPL
jgi:hypothetical protein